ncbi:hypothetical protein [Citricoccus nitrophenolicus]|uniref:hypothetical protein n=1 Tax=Citricoccus nitrophenolicus TaxID=863575 RepID=UPI0031E7CF83
MDILLNVFQFHDIVAAAPTGGEGLADGIRRFVGPLLMLIVGLVAITFLVRREMTQFLIFLGISIVVFILFFAPDVLKGIAQGTEQGLGTGGNWKN